MTAEPSRRNGERVKRGRRSKRTINRRAMALLGRKSVECKSADASASGGSHDLTISRRILACTKQAISKLNSWIGAEIGAETQRETRCFIIIANLSSNKRERERERAGSIARYPGSSSSSSIASGRSIRRTSRQAKAVVVTFGVLSIFASMRHRGRNAIVACVSRYVIAAVRGRGYAGEPRVPRRKVLIFWKYTHGIGVEYACAWTTFVRGFDEKSL